MCGICGQIKRKGLVDRDMVARMQGHLIHRGPDDGGDFFTPQMGMAMRRLSIIDPTGGWQPLYNEDRSLVLIANGEIYNFVELREGLESRGHEFRTASDCETILHLYEEHGTDCVHSLRGMFAFALWDCRRRRMVLVRDRMGEKPLYLWERPGELFFASELRSLLSSGAVPFELDPGAVDLFFHYNYVPEPRTPVKGVRKLPAAHILTVDVDGWDVREQCYWRMEHAAPLSGDPVELIREELDRVTELVIRADVPVGVALSGGLDSSVIASLAREKYSDTMHAFCVGYTGRPACDERQDAKEFADHLGMPFHEAELSTSELVSVFPELCHHSDDPIADVSGFGYYAVSRLAREHNVPVILQGQGGDELFWGYAWVCNALRDAQLKNRLVSGDWKAAAHYLWPQWPDGLRKGQLWRWMTGVAGVRTGWRTYTRHRGEPREKLPFYDFFPEFASTSDYSDVFYGPAMQGQVAIDNAYQIFMVDQPWPDVDVLLTRLICQTYLLENGIAQGDRMSMASSIELRLPLVDYRFVETVVGLRKAQSDQSLPPKAWFRQAVSEDVPPWVMGRRKRGFEPPVVEWRAALSEAHGHCLSDGILSNAGIIDAGHLSTDETGEFPKETARSVMFAALVLELWARAMSEVVT
ncbi:asparagine synthase (glutamine-hydrolyzing) [Verrucomicrobiota bacterium]